MYCSPGQVAGGTSLPSGAYCPILDRLEAGLELVREAATQSGLTLGEDLSVIIDVGANRLFDQVGIGLCTYFILWFSALLGTCVCVANVSYLLALLTCNVQQTIGLQCPHIM